MFAKHGRETGGRVRGDQTYAPKPKWRSDWVIKRVIFAEGKKYTLYL